MHFQVKWRSQKMTLFFKASSYHNFWAHSRPCIKRCSSLLFSGSKKIRVLRSHKSKPAIFFTIRFSWNSRGLCRREATTVWTRIRPLKCWDGASVDNLLGSLNILEWVSKKCTRESFFLLSFWRIFKFSSFLLRGFWCHIQMWRKQKKEKGREKRLRRKFIIAHCSNILGRFFLKSG